MYSLNKIIRNIKYQITNNSNFLTKTERRRLQIRQLHAAILRTRRKLDSFVLDTGDCCHSCAFGKDYDELVAKFERQIDWMVVLQKHDGNVKLSDRLVWECM